MASLWGVKLENTKTGKDIELWFDDPEEMELHIKVFSRETYKIKEYLHEQQALMFDIRD